MNVRKRLSGWGPFCLTSLLDQMELLLWGEGSQVCVCVLRGYDGEEAFQVRLVDSEVPLGTPSRRWLDIWSEA